MVSMEDAARMASELPDVTEGVRYRHRTWFVGGKAFAWERPFSKADLKRFGDTPTPGGPILAIRVADLVDKDAALAAEPSFFDIPHFDGYAAVLVQLDRVSGAVLRKALRRAWAACAPDGAGAPNRRRARRKA